MLGVVAVVLLVATAVVAIRNPFHGLVVAFATKPVVELAWEFRFGPITPVDAFYSIVPILLLPRAISYARQTPRLRRWLFFGACLAIANGLGLVTAVTDAKMMTVVETSAKVFNVFAAFVLIPCLVDTEKRFYAVLIAIAVGNIVPCGIGVFQAATGQVWRTRSTIGLQRHVGLYHDATGVRFNGQQAVFAIGLLAATLYSQKKRIQLGLLAYLAMWLVVLFFVFSKAAVVTILGWFVLWCMTQRKIGWALGVIVLAIGVDYFNESGVSSRLSQLFAKEIGYHQGTLADDRYVLAGRMFIWESALKRWSRVGMDQKVLGTGRNFPVHNEVLRLLIHSGYVGAGLFVSVMFLLGVTVMYAVFARATLVHLAGAMAFMMMVVDSIGLHPGLYAGHQWFVWGFVGLSFMASERFDASSTMDAAVQSWFSPDEAEEVPIRMTGIECPA